MTSECMFSTHHFNNGFTLGEQEQDGAKEKEREMNKGCCEYECIGQECMREKARKVPRHNLSMCTWERSESGKSRDMRKETKVEQVHSLFGT